MANNEVQPKHEHLPSLEEDILAEFGHLFVRTNAAPVDTSWALHVERQRPLNTHFFSAHA